MEWHKQVRECMREVRFDKVKKPKLNESQCDNLCRAFLAKLSKFCAVGWPAITGVSPKLKRVSQCREETSRVTASHPDQDEDVKILLQRAWKEAYRVIREAETYLLSCSGTEWWKKAPVLAATGEAHVVHMHDLLWCAVCLDLSLAYAGNPQEEAYVQVCCRRMGEFAAEMNNPLSIHDLYVDKKQLAITLECMRKDFESKNTLRRIILNCEEENKARVAKFVAERLNVTELTALEWHGIDPRDLKRKNQSQSFVDCDQLCEGLWLGVKVGVKEISWDCCQCLQTRAPDLIRLQSPFLLQFLGLCLDGGRCFLVTEVASSSLVKLVEEKGHSVPLHVGIDVMLQISRGVEYMHSQRVMHLDLRPSNVLMEPTGLKDFRDEGHCRVKILYMGMPNLNLNNYCCWMAPEALKECTYKADVFSFGMICYQILTGKQPFEGDVLPGGKLYESIMEGQRPVWPESACPSLLADYIGKCWDNDPANRPHFYEISRFLRYMKLLVMRIPSPPKPNSFWAVCREFDRNQIRNFFEGLDSPEEKVTSEEEGLIIRALDGDFPECFRTLNGYGATVKTPDAPLAVRRSFSARFLLRPQSTDIKSLVTLPAYVKKYSYEELHKATSGFELKLTSCTNSFSVWKAILPDRTHVAVKLFEKVNFENFRNEATVLSQVHHPNILRLRGVCTGASKYMLVYDYMAMGTLEKILFSTGQQNHVLNWVMRRRIALGTARGLAYLHHDCGNKFLSVKVDTNTILLDERFSAKLCGFGLAKPADYGSYNWQKKSEQEDEEVANAYSFGVVLLEILTGCRCIDTPFSDYYSLHESVHGIGSKSVMEFVDHRLRNEMGEKEARNMINLGLWCIIKDPSLRPSMNRVVLVMEGLLDLCAPPLGRIEILPPPLRSHHFLRYQRSQVMNNNPSNMETPLPIRPEITTIGE